MIELSDLTVDYGDFLLSGIDLQIDEGEFFVIMGPTGAGKTVLLEAIAGIAPLQRGSISMDGREISRLPPEKRGMGLVYQDYALFPHLSVEQNIRFGLRYQRESERRESEARFSELIGQLALGDLLHRRPETLSGGEAQRVALARSLITRPRMLLLDEPLSALDQAFREEIRNELRELHRRTGIIFLMVTHDFRDALALGNRAAVLHRGRIEQVGEVREIYRRPAKRFVADFVGMGNILEARFAADGVTAYAEGLEVQVPEGAREEHSRFPEGTERRFIAIRPEDIVLSTQPLESSLRNRYRGRIVSIRDYGIAYEVRCRVGETDLIAHVTRGAILDLGLEEGMEIHLSWKATATHLL